MWQTTNQSVIQKIKQGTVMLADLQAAGAVQRGVTINDYAGAGCSAGGTGCQNLYAVSIAGVPPSCCMRWFQALIFAKNAGKRLPTNAEWQVAATGTPDPGVSPAGSSNCNTANGAGSGSDAPVATGSRSNCVSAVGAFDMVGNVTEWVNDWVVPQGGACGSWGAFSDDVPCLGGITTLPGALLRGGAALTGGGLGGTAAGPFAVFSVDPSLQGPNVGFRAAR